MNAKTFKISVITVCFNSLETIAGCLGSVLAQDYENFEYIVLDGGSTDGTIEIIEAHRDGIAHFQSEPDLGLYYAMNKALSLAKGEWVLFLNSDDRLTDSKTLSKAAPFLKKRGCNYYGIAEVLYDGSSLYQKPKNLQPINFERDLPIHQTVFISSAFRNKRFDTCYRIAADSIYLYELSKISEFRLIPLQIACFELGGVSSWHPNFASYALHLKEHLALLNLRKSSLITFTYTILAFTTKFFLSKILSKQSYFKMVAHVTQLIPRR